MRPRILVSGCLFFGLQLLALPVRAQQEPPEIIAAINDGNLARVQALLEAGADPNVLFHNRTPLMFALYGDHVEIFHLLVERGADLEVESEGVGPLITLAAESGSLALLEFLLDQGADIDAREPHGQTPLMLAVHNGHPQVVGALVERGASLDLQEGKGWTALMFGAMHGDLASVNLLIEGGCDVNLRTTDGESPLDRARALLEADLGGGDYSGVIAALIGAGAVGGVESGGGVQAKEARAPAQHPA